jgi:thioredoxin-like negative regulator of GroEL
MNRKFIPGSSSSSSSSYSQSKVTVGGVKRVQFSTDVNQSDEKPQLTKTMTKIDEWNEIIDSKTPVVFQCSTSWCRPCQVLKPLMEKAVAKFDGKVTFYYIDIEKFPEVAEMLQVSSVPHVFAVKGGEVIDEFQGVQSDQQIEEFYNKAAESQ